MQPSTSERNLAFSAVVGMAAVLTGLVLYTGGLLTGVLFGLVAAAAVFGADLVGVFHSEVDLAPELGSRLELAERVYHRLGDVPPAEPVAEDVEQQPVGQLATVLPLAALEPARADAA